MKIQNFCNQLQCLLQSLIFTPYYIREHQGGNKRKEQRAQNIGDKIGKLGRTPERHKPLQQFITPPNAIAPRTTASERLHRRRGAETLPRTCARCRSNETAKHKPPNIKKCPILSNHSNVGISTSGNGCGYSVRKRITTTTTPEKRPDSRCFKNFNIINSL